MTEEVLQVHEQRSQVEQAPPRLEVDQEVDVAGGVRLPARHRPEHADVAGAVAGGEGQNLTAHAGRGRRSTVDRPRHASSRRRLA
jgi:hypothetical protein